MTRRNVILTLLGSSRILAAARGLLFERSVPARMAAASSLPLQGWAPANLGLAVTADGRTAWVSFSLDDALLEVDLTVPVIRAAIDLSPAGVMLDSGKIVLSADEKLLFLANYGTGNIAVVDTAAGRITSVLPLSPSVHNALGLSADGSRLYVATNDGNLATVSLAGLSVHQATVPGNDFRLIAPSRKNPKWLYCAGGDHFNGLNQSALWVFDVDAGSIVQKAIVPNSVWHAGAATSRMTLSKAEDVAWIGWCDYLSDDRGQGSLSVVDLSGLRVLSTTPMDYGVTDMAVDERAGKIYATGFWAGGGAPDVLPVAAWDISSKTITRRYTMSPSTDQRAIVLDPADSGSAYMTEGDLNFLRKFDVRTGAEVQKVKFSRQRVRPHSFIKAGEQAYVACQGSSMVFRLDLQSGNVENAFLLPDGMPGIVGGAFLNGVLYFLNGRTAYRVDPQTGAVLARATLPWNVVTLVPVFAGGALVALNLSPGDNAPQLVVLDAHTMQLVKAVPLPPDIYSDMPVVSPDGTKVYVARGATVTGPTQVMIFSSSDWGLRKAIDIPATPNSSGGSTGFLDGDFDESRRILYLTGFDAIYRIHMDTDALLGVLPTMDALLAAGRPMAWTATGLSGARLSAGRDRLFVVAADSRCMYVYDTVNQRWQPDILNLRGYFLTDVTQSSDRRYLYTADENSDSLSMVDCGLLQVTSVIGPLSGPTAQIWNARVANAASLRYELYRLWPVAPGEIVTIFGTDIGPAGFTSATAGGLGNLPTELGGTRVLIEGVPAAILSAYTDSVTAIVPDVVAGMTSARLQLECNGQPTNATQLAVADSAPGLYTADSSGSGQAAALNQDGSTNSSANPAAPGTAVVLFGTGQGLTNALGQIGNFPAFPIPKPRLPVLVSIGGVGCDVLYAGVVVRGIFLVCVRVSSTVSPGQAVPVVVTAGSNSSQPGVTIAVG